MPQRLHLYVQISGVFKAEKRGGMTPVTLLWVRAWRLGVEREIHSEITPNSRH